jgi:3-methyladenine DNA glycosylase AlkD
MKVSDVRAALHALANPEKQNVFKNFFKTGAGEYGEGDIFLGLTVPQQRKISKEFKDLPLNEAEKLLRSKIHEERLTALLIFVLQYKKGDEPKKKSIVDAYLRNFKFVNNWDLVDSSAPYILGDWLLKRDRRLLYKMAKSKVLWEKRIAILSTFAFIYAGEYKDTFAIGEILLHDKHDLIHKAVGWMLREVGKRIHVNHLRTFLRAHSDNMPRTALRYAIEHLPEKERRNWLNSKKSGKDIKIADK